MVLLVAAERLELYRAIMTPIVGYLIDIQSTTYAAMLAVGTLSPAVLLVELIDDAQQRLEMISTITGNSQMDSTRVLVVTESQEEIEQYRDQLTPNAEKFSLRHIETELPSALRILIPQPSSNSTRANPGFPLPPNELERAAAVIRSGLLNSSTDETFDDITWLASQMLQMPIALITLLLPEHQRFKARQGFGIKQTPRSWAFCNYVILEDGVFVVQDAASDPRFSASPLVDAAIGIRFYAGVALKDEQGFALGSLCVMDKEPRSFNRTQMKYLRVLAALTEDKIRLKNRTRQAEWFLSKTRSRV
jgi:GAF domain